jgi:hypothetical protein
MSILNINDLACKYGEQIADAWIVARMNDGSSAPQLDTLYSQAAGRHRPDPLDPKQQALGRNWGLVTPFVLDNENDQSRIYLGVHWQFDAKGGNKLGTAIANKVFEKFK